MKGYMQVLILSYAILASASAHSFITISEDPAHLITISEGPGAPGDFVFVIAPSGGPCLINKASREASLIISDTSDAIQARCLSICTNTRNFSSTITLMPASYYHITSAQMLAFYTSCGCYIKGDEVRNLEPTITQINCNGKVIKPNLGWPSTTWSHYSSCTTTSGPFTITLP